MAFKSVAQRNHCLALVKKGEMTKAQFDVYDKPAPGEKLTTLPEKAPVKTKSLVRGDRQPKRPIK
jgi:hypothetical protein